MATRIDAVASRDKLKPWREPYWHPLRRGCCLGCRKMTGDGAGVWIACARDKASGPTRQLYESVVDFGALPDHQRFDAASMAAQAWFEHLGRGSLQGSATVADACARYNKQLRTHKTDWAADGADARQAQPLLEMAQRPGTIRLTRLHISITLES